MIKMESHKSEVTINKNCVRKYLSLNLEKLNVHLSLFELGLADLKEKLTLLLYPISFLMEVRDFLFFFKKKKIN